MYTKLLQGLYSIGWEIHRDLLAEFSYIIYHYSETKTVLDPVFDRPVRRSTG